MSSTATAAPVLLESVVIVAGNGNMLEAPFTRTDIRWTNDPRKLAEFSSQSQAKLVMDEIRRIQSGKYALLHMDDPNAGYSMTQRAYTEKDSWDAAVRIERTAVLASYFLADLWAVYLRGGA